MANAYTQYLRATLSKAIDQQTFSFKLPELDSMAWYEMLSTSADDAERLEDDAKHLIGSVTHSMLETGYPELREEAAMVTHSPDSLTMAPNS